MAQRYRYSRWDGTQRGFEFGADEVFAELTDDLAEHGDVDAALRRLINDGFGSGRDRLPGLRELFDRLRDERRRRLEQFDLGSVYDDLVRELDDIVDEERHQLDADSELDASRRLELDFLPDDLPGKVEALQRYSFASPQAAGRFDDFVDRLRQRFASQLYDRLAGSMHQLDEAGRAEMTEMMAAINEMIARRDRGEDPQFEQFMERFGSWFPEQPSTLDELLEAVARRMAAMQALLNSLSPEQRAELEALSAQLLGDADLQAQMAQLAASLQGQFPDAGWDAGYDFDGTTPLGFDEALEQLRELADLDQLAQLLRTTSSPSALSELDFDAVSDLLGDDATRSLRRMAELTDELRRAGLVDQRTGELRLTPAGLRRLGGNALRDVFDRLDSSTFGQHQLPRIGAGHELSGDTRPIEFGDPFRLDLQRTLRNALRRLAAAGGGRPPLRLVVDDFEVDETEQLVRSSTVLLLDLSMSMPMEGRFVPAKKVAMALQALIASQFPHDDLDIVVFSETARRISPAELPSATWDYVYGTNMHHALTIARQLLADKPGNRQVLMVTDGEPTAHITDAGLPQFHYPPLPETIDKTLREVLRCTRAGIRINTFMLGTSPPLRAFVERVAAINHGRAFFTTPDDLGDYVLVDFLADHRRRSVRRRR